MKLAVIVLCLVAFSQAATITPELQREWEHFSGTHKKTYSSALEREFRFEIFRDNLEKINKHNKDYEEGRATYTMKMNEFGDLLLSEFLEKMTGAIQQEKAPATEEVEVLPEAPSSIDWRQYGAVTPVKNQGSCGSCWSFSATGALEGAHHRATGQLVSLSEQNLCDCSRSYGNMGCSGGIMQAAFQYVVANRGIDTESSYPYTGRDSYSCRYNPSTIGATARSYSSIPTDSENSLMNAVGTVGPVSIAVNANSGWQFYNGGVFSDSSCTSSGLNHGVLAVGYTSQYWLVKNSWGGGWGEGGYIKLAKGRNMCGLAHDASYPIV